MRAVTNPPVTLFLDDSQPELSPIHGAAGRVVAVVRPESLSIHPPGQATLTGRVESVSFVGDRQRVSVSGAADKPILIEASNRLAISPGEHVGVAADAGAVRLLAG